MNQPQKTSFETVSLLAGSKSVLRPTVLNVSKIIRFYS